MVFKELSWNPGIGRPGRAPGAAVWLMPTSSPGTASLETGVVLLLPWNTLDRHKYHQNAVSVRNWSLCVKTRSHLH